jgi:hypothetical protein
MRDGKEREGESERGGEGERDMASTTAILNFLLQSEPE